MSEPVWREAMTDKRFHLLQPRRLMVSLCGLAPLGIKIANPPEDARCPDCVLLSGPGVEQGTMTGLGGVHSRTASR